MHKKISNYVFYPWYQLYLLFQELRAKFGPPCHLIPQFHHLHNPICLVFCRIKIVKPFHQIWYCLLNLTFKPFEKCWKILQLDVFYGFFLFHYKFWLHELFVYSSKVDVCWSWQKWNQGRPSYVPCLCFFVERYFELDNFPKNVKKF